MVLMNTVPVRRSRLTKQENRKMTQQTFAIIGGTVLFVILFLWLGIPSLIKLAVALGNSKAVSKFNQQEDTLAPFPPQINSLPEATSSSIISIQGFAEAGSLIALSINTVKQSESTADNQGNFSFSDVILQEGDNQISLVATDPTGNHSQPSTPQNVIFDNDPPEIAINSPSDGAKIYGLLQQLTTISGSTEPTTQLTVNDRHIVVTGDGSFSTKYELQEGDNKLTFTATDPAGNQTVQEMTVNFSK